MRTLIDIPDDQLDELDRLARQEKLSRAALVRQAIRALLATRQTSGEAAIAAAFGIRPDLEDGLVVQDLLRREW
jgi:metal-responsive CopG/Arc/MetJ family transcriptional regulator